LQIGPLLLVIRRRAPLIDAGFAGEPAQQAADIIRIVR
jgi:hypothetical protein